MPALTRLVSSLLLALTLAGSARADIDLSGRWFTPNSTTGFAEIVQTGSDVALTWTETGGPVTYTGTFDQTTVNVGPIQVTARAGGNILYGYRYAPPVFQPVLLRRCECDDEDTMDGDGCDSVCRVEECYTCTGEPSVCVPSVDAAPCDDRNECTTGETCTSGACSAGTPVPSCIHVGGLWRVNSEGYTYLYEEQAGSSENRRFVQQDGAVLVYDENGHPGQMPYAVGEIDTSSGTMSYASTAPSSSVFCSPASRFNGEASPDAGSFAGTISYSYDAHPIGSCAGDVVDATGTRCHPTLGCDLADCSGLPDGTPCDDGNVCTNRDACSAGTCAARFKCPACQACYDGDCEDGPRWDCAVSWARRSNQLSLNWWTEPHQVRWSWKKGSATTLESFGNPAATSEVAVCIYDGSDELVYRNVISPDEPCDEPSCWKEKGDRVSFKGSDLTLSLRAGADGRAAISYKSSEWLPSDLDLPLDPTLQVQLQIDNGVCFQSWFDENSIKKNEYGKLKATGPE